MRDARFVGLAADGQWLIVERDGEHLRVPIDDDLRRALADGVLDGGMQMPMPLQTTISPREVQQRIRAGETAAQIARATGVAVELVARFEGPVLDERRWQAERARRTVVEGMSLEERFAVATQDDESSGAPTSWDAWVDAEDGGWRVRAMSPDGRAAVWAWDAQTTKLRSRDDLARRTLSGAVVGDDLEAVLRPIAAARAERDRLEQVDEPTPARPAGKRRASVPSWDEIMLGSTGRPTPES